MFIWHDVLQNNWQSFATCKINWSTKLFFWCLPILQPILLLQFGYTGNYFMQGLVNSSYPEALVAGDCALVNISHNFLTLTKHSWLRGCENFPWGVTSSYVTPVQAVCIRYDQLKETLGVLMWLFSTNTYLHGLDQHSANKIQV